jgi:succinyl-diaminopimelate desuccinylase
VPDNKGLIRPSLIVTVKGLSKKVLWVIAHLDTVSAGCESDWKHPPFKATFSEDRKKVYGRGTSDNGIGIFSSLILIDRIFSQGKLPKYTLKIAFVADEEEGSTYGIKYLLSKTNEFNRGNYAIVADYGMPTGNSIEIAEKGILWVKQECIGKQCHGSTPSRGINAHLHNMRFALMLYDLLHKRFNADNNLFTEEKKSTFEITRKETNSYSINIIPGNDVLYWDMRILPEYKLSTIKNFIRTQSSTYSKKNNIKFSFSFTHEENSSLTKKDCEIVSRLKAAVYSELKISPLIEGIGGGTFAGILRKKGIECAAWAVLSGTEHIVDEYELIQNYYSTAAVIIQLVGL